ncbi:MAG: exo-alpha-sialidase [Pirellulaceae bacterium]|nr:exo-alpha-sialidase [Pirellulaceae bacterium]
MACRRNRPGASRYRLEVHASNDRGRSWALRSILAEGRKGLWEPLLLLMPDGTIQAYYASEEASHPDQTIEMRVSTDRGKTWSASTTVAAKRGSRDGMPGVTRLPSGELLVVFEAQDMPPFRFIVRAVRSNDGGRTWPNHRELVYRPSASTSDRWSAGAPAIVLTRSGGLLAAFQTDERVSYHRNTPENDPRHPDYNYVRHTTLAVIRSDDGGKTWSDPTYLVGGPGDSACWNGLYSLSDGGVLVLTTHRGRVWCKRMGNSLRED